MTFENAAIDPSSIVAASDHASTPPLTPLRLGAQGERVRQWQTFLVGRGFHAGVVDGDFGPATRWATIAFQRRHGLGADGVVGDRTLGQAMVLGHSVLEDADPGRDGPNWPPAPDFPPLVGGAAREQLFGRFRYEPAPTRSSPERIRVLDGWAHAHIVRIELPQLVALGLRRRPEVLAHRLVAERLQALWQAWENAGLLDLVLSWNGSYMPRYVRGSRTVLSAHAFGAAFDINARYNHIGAIPALRTARGSTRALVPIANAHGFYWGGHYKHRPDGMHFEAVRLASPLG